MLRTGSVLAIVLAWTIPAFANAESARLRARAYDLAYNLDYDVATREMEAAARADPQDVAAQRGLAAIPWLLISFQRGTVLVDNYLGSLSRGDVALRSPPADLAARFARHIDAALALAERQATRRRSDPEALYQLGATVALQATYTATVEGRILAGFRSARRAYDAHERVLELIPARKDAALTVGMYRYIVSAMSLPIRLLAYVAGFGGDGQLGLRMIEEAAMYRSEAQADARFALVLLYNRERRYGEALQTLETLQARFPRNRILWLEMGATALRAGRPMEAERALVAGMQRLADDQRPRMFGEEAVWYQKRGAARLALGRLTEAESDLRRVLTLEARPWVAGRAHAELGKLADLRGNRQAARQEFQHAVRLAEEDNDPIGAAAAGRFVDTPFRQE